MIEQEGSTQELKPGTLRHVQRSGELFAVRRTAEQWADAEARVEAGMKWAREQGLDPASIDPDRLSVSSPWMCPLAQMGRRVYSVAAKRYGLRPENEDNHPYNRDREIALGFWPRPWDEDQGDSDALTLVWIQRVRALQAAQQDPNVEVLP